MLYHNVIPLLAPSKKDLSFSFILAKKRIYLDTQLKGEFTNLFLNSQGVPCSYRQSRNRMMNTFIIGNITYIRDTLEDKSMLVHFKKAFPLTSSLGNSFERRAY